MNTENFVTIRTYHDHIIAEIMIAALNNAGIKVFGNEDSSIILPTDNIIEIKVHESDTESALEIIEAQEAL